MYIASNCNYVFIINLIFLRFQEEEVSADRLDQVSTVAMMTHTVTIQVICHNSYICELNSSHSYLTLSIFISCSIHLSQKHYACMQQN